jgi:hypothetical protein
MAEHCSTMARLTGVNVEEETTYRVNRGVLWTGEEFHRIRELRDRVS